MSPLEIKRLIVDVPDFPRPGIVFKDITPVLAFVYRCSSCASAASCRAPL
jgi:hypothetical protein